MSNYYGSHLPPSLVSTVEDRSQLVHYDIATQSIIEPLSTVTVNTLLVNDSIDEAQVGQGIQINADIEVAAGKNLILETLQGPDADPIEVLNSMQFDDAGEGVKFTSGGSILSTHIDSSFTANFTGPIASTPCTVNYEVTGKRVTLYLNTFTAAYAGPDGQLASGATEVPAAIRPPDKVKYIVPVTNNGIHVSGSLLVYETGLIEIGVGVGGNFTAGNCGIGASISVSYLIS